MSVPVALVIALRVGIHMWLQPGYSDLKHPKHFESPDIAFDYPGNWKITKDEQTPRSHLIQLEGTGHAIVVLTLFNRGYSPDLPTYAEAFLRKGFYEKGHPYRESGRSIEPLPGPQRIDFEFEMDNYYFTGCISLHQAGAYKMACVTTVANEWLSQNRSGFDLIKKSVSSAQSSHASQQPTRPSVAVKNSGPETGRSNPAQASTQTVIVRSIAGIGVGMTKEQVTSLLGEPNIKSNSTWVYSGKGAVKFSDGRVVSTKEANSD